MALSLDDIKKNKAKRSSNKASPKLVKKKLSPKTKPWEKSEPVKEISFKKPDMDDSKLLEKALNWSRKIKLFPEIDIPVPKFLLTKDDD